MKKKLLVLSLFGLLLPLHSVSAATIDGDANVSKSTADFKINKGVVAPRIIMGPPEGGKGNTGTGGIQCGGGWVNCG
ncbi:hypothetical protein B5723_15140 [Mammaliicoccus sciuri]|nr:hypothetical protein B5723_15140 [Mammaliicoccus sciuri]